MDLSEGLSQAAGTGAQSAPAFLFAHPGLHCYTLRMKKDEKLDAIRHSLAHLLASAVLERDPEAELAIGPTVETGFYYDFKLTKPLSEEDLPTLEERMRELIKEKLPFERIDATPDQAREQYKHQPFKLELIDEIEEHKAGLTLYQTGSFIDLCRGGHVKNTSDIDPHSFKLTHIAGAYWRGDEKRPMLTRIYGAAFADNKALTAYVEQQAEAKKRDHRVLGKALDLYTFSELVGSGLPLYTPRGTALRDALLNYSEELQRAGGFEKVWIPHITKNDLYKTSGHWDKFGHELFLVKSQETSDSFALKPMNCPHHTQIYASRARSYRDLPIRYMESTTCYRDEKTGELAGLSRLRAFTQDDGHVFAAMEQIEAEFESILSMIKTMYEALKLDFRARLSFHDPKQKEKYLGGEDVWQKAERIIEEVARKLALDYTISPGEAAFYGPKIDILVTDALGREWQTGTAQLDFVQPERFGLEYTAEDGSKKTPVMIHKALLGSIDRFLAVYIEHTAGVFPFWVAPEQVRVLPVSDKHVGYAGGVHRALRVSGLRTTLDGRNESLGKKIRDAKLEKLPYFIVVGDKEAAAKTVTLEGRDGPVGSLTLEELIKKLRAESEACA